MAVSAMQPPQTLSHRARSSPAQESVTESLLRLISKRQSTRIPFDPEKEVSKRDLAQIVEAARWAPTAHNMQNFEIIAVNDKKLLKAIGKVRTRISEDFLRENYQQLSFSKEEFLKKQTGVLAATFPRSWIDPAKFHFVAHKAPLGSLNDTIRGSPLVMVVVYDSQKRAPASEGDFLGILSLGCVMENMWLVAQFLSIGFQIMSVFSSEPAQSNVKRLLGIPTRMKIAYAIRLGYPVSRFPNYLRVRRSPERLAYLNGYKATGEKISS